MSLCTSCLLYTSDVYKRQEKRPRNQSLRGNWPGLIAPSPPALFEKTGKVFPKSGDGKDKRAYYVLPGLWS